MTVQITMDPEQLHPGSYYWAQRSGSDDVEVVQVSNTFGSDIEYWTVAVMGSDQHHNLSEFAFLIRLIKP